MTTTKAGCAARQAELDALDVDTPALLLDLDRFERNVARLAGFLKEAGVAWRPHSKAHKSPELARMQIEAGAIGVTCAKVSEAEVMVDHGIPSVLVANMLGRPRAFDRVARLQHKAEVLICMDNAAHVAMAAAAAIAEGVEIPVLVEVDVGLRRTGTDPGEPALALARSIDHAPGLRFAGLMGYEGQFRGSYPLAAKEARAHESLDQLVDTARLIEGAGLAVGMVTGGSSGTYMASGRVNGMTEMQAGGVCLMDMFYSEDQVIAERDFEYAVTVLATVVSRPRPDRVVVDSGFKALSNREGKFPRPTNPDLEVTLLSAEHGTLRASGDAQMLDIGDRVEFILDYTDATIFRHDTFVAMRSGRVDHIIPILGRGRLT